MRYLVFTILFFLSFIQERNNEILWSPQKLVWNDFTGIVKSKDANLLAITQCEIRITDAYWDGSIPKYIVKCFFIKDKSWTRVNDKITLAHEQLHFDIYELYTRKIRKEFTRLNLLGETNTELYNKTYNDFLNKAVKENELYDNEVYFNEIKQNKWNNRIAKELKCFED